MKDKAVRIPLEWKEAGAATNREPHRKCLKGFAPTLTSPQAPWDHMGNSREHEPAHLATITPLPHGDSRRPRIKFFLQFGFRGRNNDKPGSLTTGEFKTLKAAKHRAEKLHGDLMAHEMEKFLKED